MDFVVLHYILHKAFYTTMSVPQPSGSFSIRGQRMTSCCVSVDMSGSDTVSDHRAVKDLICHLLHCRVMLFSKGRASIMLMDGKASQRRTCGDNEVLIPGRRLYEP